MYSEHVVLENEEPEPVAIEVTCAMRDLRLVIAGALGAVVITAALSLWFINRIRLW